MSDVVAEGLAGGTPKFWEMLWEFGAKWECRWNEAVAGMAHQQTLNQKEAVKMPTVDRAWAQAMQQHLMPRGFQIGPEAITRLL